MKEKVLPFEAQISKLFNRADFEEILTENGLINHKFLLIGLFAEPEVISDAPIQETGDKPRGFKVYVNDADNLGNDWFVANGYPEGGIHELRYCDRNAFRFLMTRTYYLTRGNDGKLVTEYLYNDKDALNQKIMKRMLNAIAWKNSLRPSEILTVKMIHIEGNRFPEVVMALEAVDTDSGERYLVASCLDNGRLSITPADRYKVLENYDLNKSTVIDTPFSRYMDSANGHGRAAQDIVWLRAEWNRPRHEMSGYVWGKP